MYDNKQHAEMQAFVLAPPIVIITTVLIMKEIEYLIRCRNITIVTLLHNELTLPFSRDSAVYSDNVHVSLGEVILIPARLYHYL